MARLRPYIIRATYQWLVDHGFTPYFLVDAEEDKVEVPWEYVEDGKIVLNASPTAIRNIQLENDFVGFEASFGGTSWQIFFPTSAVLALYSPETGQGVYVREEGIGMMVNEGETEDDLDPKPTKNNDEKPTSQAPDNKKKGPGLRLIK